MMNFDQLDDIYIIAYRTETRVTKKENLRSLERPERMIVRWMLTSWYQITLLGEQGHPSS